MQALHNLRRSAFAAPSPQSSAETAVARLYTSLSDEQKKTFAERTAVKRWGQPIDMVGPVLFKLALDRLGETDTSAPVARPSLPPPAGAH